MGFNHCEPTWLGMAPPTGSRPAGAPRLTSREREVLRRIADGQSTRQIARDLAIAASTARTHASNVLVKLGARSRIQAVATMSPPPAPILEPHASEPALALRGHAEAERIPYTGPGPDLGPDLGRDPDGDLDRELGRGLDPLAALTRREREVLACMVEGLAQATMAERLSLSPHTVRTHARNILGKLGVHSTLEAAALVRRIHRQAAERQTIRRRAADPRPTFPDRPG